MHKKAVIIIAIIVGVLIITSGVVGAIVALNRSVEPAKVDPTVATKDVDPLKQEDQTTPDLSVDLGACTTIPLITITKNLKPPVTDIRDAENRGFGYENGGNRSQSCVYAFSAENNLNNRLTITVSEFKDNTSKSDAIKGLEDYEAVSGIGEEAGFTSSQDAEFLKQNTYSLFVIKGQEQFTFAITQPSESDVFTVTTAKAALEEIAKTL